MRLAEKCKIFFEKFHFYFIFGKKERFLCIISARYVQNVQENSHGRKPNCRISCKSIRLCICNFTFLILRYAKFMVLFTDRFSLPEKRLIIHTVALKTKTII